MLLKFYVEPIYIKDRVRVMIENETIKNFFIDIINFIIFYFVARKFWGSEAWYSDTMKQMLFFLGTSLLLIIVRIIFIAFTMPVRVKIEQSNKIYQGVETNYLIKGRKKTLEEERTVELTISVEKHSSFWGIFVVYLLKKIDYSIVVEGATLGILVQAKDEQRIPWISSTTKGFEIKIGEYIEDLIRNTPQVNVYRVIEYKVVEDENNFAPTERFVIYPKIKEKGLVYKCVTLLTRLNVQEHTINFCRE